MTYFDDVKNFHLIFHIPPNTPIHLDGKKWAHRVKLITEEFAETCAAYANDDFEKFADGLIDLTWVVIGSAVEAGLPFDELWNEVKRANMDKKGGKLDHSGKLLKPPNWHPPEIAKILEKKMNNETAGETPIVGGRYSESQMCSSCKHKKYPSHEKSSMLAFDGYYYCKECGKLCKF